jgi:hypothetical protein
VIESGEAQDLLNVDISNTGKSIQKRPGYGTYKTLGTGQAVHGIHHFFDSSGNDIVIAGSSTSLYGIVQDGTPVQLLSSATLNTTWDCTDTQGNAYCVTSNRDMYVRTTGAAIAWQTTPLGTMVMSTPDRNIVAGVAATPNSMFWSESGNFLNFVAANGETSPFVKVIGSPGSKLTHIRWGCGKVLWWKDQSFGYVNGDNQTNLEVKIVSDNIGTFDNTSSQDPGGNVWFRGQDGNIWRYDCSGLEKMSVDISSNVGASGHRTSNFWTQTSQADFATGGVSPSMSLSTVTVSGSVTTSSFNVTESGSASGWSSGSASNVTVSASSITITINNSGNPTDASFEVSALSTNWSITTTVISPASVVSITSLNNCGTINPQSGSRLLQFDQLTSHSLIFETVSVDSTTVYDSTTVSYANNSCAWTQRTLTTSSSNIGKRFRVRIKLNGQNDFITSKDSYILGGNITFYTASDVSTTSPQWAIDNIQNGSSTITSGSFTSQVLNTGSPYSFVYASATWTVSTSTPGFVVQKATSTLGVWNEVSISTGVNIQSNKQYLRYISSFTISGTDDARSYLQGVQLLAQSSGTYYSAWKNASSLSAWDTFNATYSNGDGANNFSIRSSTSPQSVLNSTVPWVSQTVGALVSASTGTYFQVIDSFTITAATNTAPTLSDFTVNWFDGSSADQAYSIYHDNAVWFSVASGAGQTTNNYIFKCDLIHLAAFPGDSCWTLYNFGAGGLAIENNNLYFGSTAASTLFKYGTGTSDNGTAINAYWKSKDFTGTDPWKTYQLNQIDSYWRKNQNQTVSVTYATDTSTTTTSYTVALSSTTASIIRHGKLLPNGKNGSLFNFQIGDTSDSSAWEWFGLRANLVDLGYRPN